MSEKNSKKQSQTKTQYALPGISVNPVPSEAYIGIDEAGRGCLAGPVVSAAVWLPSAIPACLQDLADSKVLKASKREELAPLIRQEAISFGIGLSWQREIDKVNILRATHISMVRALVALRLRLDKKQAQNAHKNFQDEGTIELIECPLLLVDGNRRIPSELFAMFKYWQHDLQANKLREHEPRQRTLVNGDALAPSISAASILAKTFRDDLLSGYELRYPQYAFYLHKGYATQKHRDAVAEHGPCPIHRKTFAGVAEHIK